MYKYNLRTNRKGVSIILKMNEVSLIIEAGVIQPLFSWNFSRRKIDGLVLSDKRKRTELLAKQSNYECCFVQRGVKEQWQKSFRQKEKKAQPATGKSSVEGLKSS